MFVSGLFTMRVPKETAGQHFEGLHMLTSLLAPKGSRSAQPLVEEIGMLECYACPNLTPPVTPTSLLSSLSFTRVSVLFFLSLSFLLCLTLKELAV